MKKASRAFVFVCVGLVFSVASAGAQELKPLSPGDREAVVKLLKDFDPKSYSLKYHFVDSSGKMKTEQLGSAKGLADLEQSKTERGAARQANNVAIINLWAKARNNVAIINLWAQAARDPGNLGFLDERLRSKAQELNAILKKYLVKDKS